MKIRHYLAVALVTLILQGVSLSSCRRQRCNPHVLATCEP